MDISVLYKIPNDNVLWESDDETTIEDENENDEGTIDKTVQHVYIMNKIDDISPWSGVTGSIKRSEIGLTYYTRYPKVDHQKERFIKEVEKGDKKSQNIIDLALTKTVLNIFKEALSRNYKSILILNDTARFHNNSKLLFLTGLTNINRINPNWKVIHLSAIQSNYNTSTDKNYYYPNIYTRSHYAFIIRDIIEEGIHKLESGLSLDEFFQPYNNSKDTFVLYPNIVLNTDNILQYGREAEGYTIISRPKKTPLISVIMTAFNSARYIKYSIQSILSQTYTNFELIIIDDCSKDTTGKIIEEFARKDSRIIHLKNKTNYGTYVSKNIGIKHSKGQYITFQDSDDYSIRNRLQLQLNTLIKNDYLVCYGKYMNKDMKMQFCEITLFMRRDCIDFIGYFDSVRFGADSEYRRRLELLKIPIKVLDNYVYSRLDRLMEGNNIGNPTSLTNHKRTGMNSKLRLIYRKSFECYHSLIKTKKGMKKRTYFIDFPLDKRPFQILVNDNIERSSIIVELNDTDKYIYKVKL